MSEGLEIYDENENTILAYSDRITRILTIDQFAYADTFTKTYDFPEFMNHSPFVICSSFNSYIGSGDSVDVYFRGSPAPFERTLWYQITWSLSGSLLTVSGNKSDFYTTGTIGTARIRSNKISQPPFMLIIGVY